MHHDLETAKDLLLKNGYTCVLYYKGTEYHSDLRGVKPLLEFLDSDVDFRGFFAADKTIGAGAAHLYVLLGVRGVWANVISESGKAVLEAHHIAVFAETIVPYIINRAGDGVCPIETAVKDIDDPNEALIAIRHALQRLRHAT